MRGRPPTNFEAMRKAVSGTFYDKSREWVDQRTRELLTSRGLDPDAPIDNRLDRAQRRAAELDQAELAVIEAAIAWEKTDHADNAWVAEAGDLAEAVRVLLNVRNGLGIQPEAKEWTGMKIRRERGSFYLLTVGYLHNAHPDWSGEEIHGMAVRVIGELNAVGAQAWAPSWCASCGAPAEPWCLDAHAIRDPELPVEPGSVATLGIAELE